MKIFNLLSNTLTSYTSKELCFCVKLVNEDDELIKGTEDWYMMAQTEA